MVELLERECSSALKTGEEEKTAQKSRVFRGSLKQ